MKEFKYTVGSDIDQVSGGQVSDELEHIILPHNFQFIKLTRSFNPAPGMDCFPDCDPCSCYPTMGSGCPPMLCGPDR